MGVIELRSVEWDNRRRKSWCKCDDENGDEVDGMYDIDYDKDTNDDVEDNRSLVKVHDQILHDHTYMIYVII